MLLDRRNDLTLADFCLFHCTVLSYEFSHCKQSEFLGWLQENLQDEKIEQLGYFLKKWTLNRI